MKHINIIFCQFEIFGIFTLEVLQVVLLDSKWNVIKTLFMTIRDILVNRFFCIVLIIISSFQQGFGTEYPVPRNSLKSQQLKQTASGCMPPSAFADLDINNVRARINTGGDLWWDLAGNNIYTIPKYSSNNSLFSTAMWIGGLDDNGNLKVAAQTYRQYGVDYYTGPLSTDGTASTDAMNCHKWDKIFVCYRQQVEDFIAAYNNDPSLAGYVVPDFIVNYPAHGDPAQGQSYYLAPFYDNDHDGTYNYHNGDYPYYDLNHALCSNSGISGVSQTPTMEGNGILADQVLKGDQTLWWVLNDKGNDHASQGEAIGLEIRAQAYAYATNDELNNATFYTYEIINRSNSRLNKVWYGHYVDVELGDGWDDYVGSDVSRGLGYCYNGKDPDGTGRIGDYGAQPPAVGLDFFQGPYQDADGIDNPQNDDLGNQLCDNSINGQNFGDGIVDNERLGMQKFVFFNCSGGFEPLNCPQEATGFYNFLQGIWLDGEPMRYWGNAHPIAGGVGPLCSFMYPAKSDPCHWSTNGIDPDSFHPGESWTEEQAGNEPFDRRFSMSTGPFTLEPGEVNYITIGVPWARATSGGPMASVELLKLVDDKFQALFDHCFKVLEGPDAPDVTIQELDRELIIYLSNRKFISNNYNETPEDYAEVDPSIVYADTIPASERGDSAFRFEGYQIYQLKDASVTTADLKDPDKARLLAQCDLKNGVSKLINYYYDEDLAAPVPVEEVNGSDAGIVHSFRVFEDLFASGDNRLVNHKQYYYMAIAYAYNNYLNYNPNDPYALLGQQRPYLCGKKSATGAISCQVGIPHIPSPEAGGTIAQSEYGIQPKITRIEGQGNGGMNLDFTAATSAQVLANGSAGNLEYEYNSGPVNVKVVDPLNVIGADYSLKFVPPADGNINKCNWLLINNETSATYSSEATISAGYEQLLMEVGLSIQVTQVPSPGSASATNNGFIDATIEFADSTKQWLSGIPDFDGYAPYNWIRSGMFIDPISTSNSDYNPAAWIDPYEAYEKVLGGTWAPFALCSNAGYGPVPQVLPSYYSRSVMMANLASVDLYITSDQSKWSRCPVFELGENTVLSQGGRAKLELRAGSTNGEQGMSWFPGYAINVETGERLNVAFGEDSWLQNENGMDMKWNPTANVANNMGELLFGGKHWIYIFGHNRDSINTMYGDVDCPAYDGGKWIKETMQISNNHDRYKQMVFKDVMWVGAPLTTFTGSWDPQQMPCDVKIRLRVAKPYKRFYSTKAYGAANPINNNYPLYTFSTKDICVTTQSQMAAEGALQLINVVPNPYYGYSSYEGDQSVSCVKITNLPVQCEISIYSVNGMLIRKFSKNDPLASVDWDLRSDAGLPIAGGLYIIYIKVDGVGEKVLKWFGALRPIGLNAF